MLDTRLLQNASGRVANASIKLEMLLFELFPPEERRSSSPTRPETMHGLTEGRSVRPAVRPGEGNSPTIKPYREYVPLVKKSRMNWEKMSCAVTYNGEGMVEAGIGSEKFLRIRILEILKETPFFGPSS